MSMKRLGPYERKVQRITNCSSVDTSKIVHIMRDDILHTVALDWVSSAEFHAAALEAVFLLDANRANYEEYFAGIGRFFDLIKLTAANAEASR
jgi:hypothetical protein